MERLSGILAPWYTIKSYGYAQFTPCALTFCCRQSLPLQILWELAFPSLSNLMLESA